MSLIGPAQGGGHATLSGVEVGYHLRGQGPLCVLVPGAPGAPPAALDDLAAFLTLLIVPPRSVNRLATLLNQLDQPRAIILGLGRGCLAALQFAQQHPDRMARLILAGPVVAPAALAALAHIPVPTLILVGEANNAALLAAEALAQHLPAARLARFPQSGPQPFADEPGAWAMTIRNFVFRRRDQRVERET